jgi:hypothetical protein
MTSAWLSLLRLAVNNSMKKLIELASRATAEVLNSLIFSVSWPVKRLLEILGSTGEYVGECLLREAILQNYTKTISPLNDMEPASKPLVKEKYNADLHLAIGSLWFFDATPRTAPRWQECVHTAVELQC